MKALIAAALLALGPLHDNPAKGLLGELKATKHRLLREANRDGNFEVFCLCFVSFVSLW